MLVEIFLKYVCLCCFWGENGIGSAIQRGYIYIWNCSLVAQKAYSSSTQLTRLKIQIDTKIPKPKSILSHLKNIPKIIRCYLSINFPIYPTSRPTKIVLKHIYLKNSKSISTLHFQTNHRTLYTNFTISNNKLLYLHKHLSNLITEPNTSISKIIPQYFICTQT